MEWTHCSRFLYCLSVVFFIHHQPRCTRTLGGTMWIILAFAVAAAGVDGNWGCQLAHDWRPQTEACRAELAEIIVFAKVLALHKESYSVYNYLPWQQPDSDLLFSAEIELQCDQAWGSMLEVPAGSRFNVSGLGYFPCYSYSVIKNNNYYFFLRWDTRLSLVTITTKSFWHTVKGRLRTDRHEQIW